MCYFSEIVCALTPPDDLKINAISIMRYSGMVYCGRSWHSLMAIRENYSLIMHKQDKFVTVSGCSYDNNYRPLNYQLNQCIAESYIDNIIIHVDLPGWGVSLTT